MKRVLAIVVVVSTIVLALAPARAADPKAAKAMTVGIGHSELAKPAEAGRQAAKQAKEALKGKTADVVFVYDSVEGGIEAKKAMLAAVAEHFPADVIHGCSAYNAITPTGPAGTVGVLALSGVSVHTAMSGLTGGHEACGKRVGEALAPAAKNSADRGQLLVLIGDCHFPINQKLVDGVLGALGKQFPVSGGAANGGLTYSKGKVYEKSNLGVLISGEFTCGFAIKKARTTEPMDVVNQAGLAFKQAIGKDGDKLQLVMAFDCGGRRGQMKDKRPLEVEQMNAAADGAPIFGFYGSGETGRDGNNAPAKGVGYHICVAAIFRK
jgi:hypothetical protein